MSAVKVEVCQLPHAEGLALPFGGCFGKHVAGFGGKADQQARPLRALCELGEDIGIGRPVERGRTIVLLELFGRRLDAPVGDGGDQHRRVGGERCLDRCLHLASGLDGTAVHS